MIPMECPTCGRRGEVPLDRLNSKLTCKKCGTVFHMDETGHITLGDPADAAKKKKKEEMRLEPVEIDPGKIFKSLPKPVRYGVPTLVILLLGGLIASRIMAAMGLGADLPTRATFVGEQFVDEKLEAIQELTTPDTREDVKKWYDRQRTRLNHKGPRVTPEDVTVLGQVFNESGGNAVTLTALHVTKPKTPPSSTSSRGPQNDLTIEIAWVWKGGRWMIDGKNTLSAADRGRGQRR